MPEVNILQRHGENDYTLRSMNIPKEQCHELLHFTQSRWTLSEVQDFMQRMGNSSAVDATVHSIARHGDNNYDVSIVALTKNVKEHMNKGTTVQGTREVLLKLIPETLAPMTRSYPAYTDDALFEECMKNPWICNADYEFPDSLLSFQQVDSPEELIDLFVYGNHSIRTGYVYQNLAFVQQVNGGDEWLTLRKAGEDWEPFESVSFGRIIETEGERYCTDYIKTLAEPTESTTVMEQGGMSL